MIHSTGIAEYKMIFTVHDFEQLIILLLVDLKQAEPLDENTRQDKTWWRLHRSAWPR